jgi:hypothetical protein
MVGGDKELGAAGWMIVVEVSSTPRDRTNVLMAAFHPSVSERYAGRHAASSVAF